MSDEWDFVEELGGEEMAEELMRSFYDRLFADVMVGFLFINSDKEALIRSQIEYVHANIGGRRGSYEGPSIRKAHRSLPILSGHFDRRHQILKDVLEDFEVSEKVRRAWIALDLAMRPMVLKQGKDVRGQGQSTCRD